MPTAFDDWVVAHARVASKPHKRIGLDDKMALFQQLATLICSGTPLLRALQIAAEQCQSTRLRQTMDEVADRVAAGNSLNAAAAAYPHIFEAHWVEVIRTGEITGQMGAVLLELNRQIQEARETRRKILGALTYPAILLVVAVVAVSVMLRMVVPTFAQMFKDMGAQLPDITQVVLDASALLVDYGLYILVGLVVAGFAFRRFARSETGRRVLQGIGLALPLTGDMLVQSAMYRFASNLSLLLKSGVPMLEALNVLQGVFQNNPHMRDALARAQDRVAAGRPLASALEETGLFTALVTNMVRIGEESGELANVMAQVAPYYKEKLESLVTRLTKLVEPVIIMGMGGTISVIMLAIYLPMFEMAGKVN